MLHAPGTGGTEVAGVSPRPVHQPALGHLHVSNQVLPFEPVIGSASKAPAQSITNDAATSFILLGLTRDQSVVLRRSMSRSVLLVDAAGELVHRGSAFNRAQRGRLLAQRRWR
jgi:hypothetical protein